MKSGPHIALAVALGYALGRSRKMKLAITVGGMMAGRRIAADPRQALQHGVRAVGSSPQLSKLRGEIQGHLLDAVKTAAMAAASNKIDSFGENLSQRAASLRTPSGESSGDSAEHDSVEGSQSQRANTRSSGGKPQPSSARASGPRGRPAQKTRSAATTEGSKSVGKAEPKTRSKSSPASKKHGATRGGRDG